MAAALTILAPTHDRPEVLARVWPSWLRQEGICQIVIVNDGSTGGYDRVFADIALACRARDVVLKVIETPRRLGAPAAKNVGLPECVCDEILTTDDDIELPDDMVAKCRAGRPAADGPVLVGPRVIYLRNGETHTAALERAGRETQPFFDMEKLILCAWAHPGAVKEFPFVTAVALWPAGLFRQGLRFYEGYGGNGYREETDPQLMAAQEYGAKVCLIPDAHCFHLPPDIAYARRGGQRRGGRLWFEYWVLKNNYVFLRRFSVHLKRNFGISPVAAWLRLAFSRLSLARLFRAFRKLG